MPPYYKTCHGYPCPYCRRVMDRGADELAPTRDHVVPRSRGGTRKIVCCSRCNHVKGDMMPDEWESFMAASPGWWLRTTKELRAIKRNFLKGFAARATERAADALRFMLNESSAIEKLESDAALGSGRPSRRPLVLPSRHTAGAVRIVYPDEP